MVGAHRRRRRGTASFAKIFSGVLSDWLGRRKGLAVLGYGLSGVAKLLFPIAAGAGGILLRPLRRSPGQGHSRARRAMRWSPTSRRRPLRGAAYGLRQALDEAGTFLGPLVGHRADVAVRSTTSRRCSGSPASRAVLSLAVLVFGVREAAAPGRARMRFPLRLAALRRLGRRFWLFIAVLLVLLLPRFTDAFYLLRGQRWACRRRVAPALLAAMSTDDDAPDRAGRAPVRPHRPAGRC